MYLTKPDLYYLPEKLTYERYLLQTKYISLSLTKFFINL